MNTTALDTLREIAARMVRQYDHGRGRIEDVDAVNLAEGLLAWSEHPDDDGADR